MKLSAFNYILPKNLIAQYPVSPRDHSRLLILEKKTRQIKHKHFYDLADYLKQGDILVLNNSRVFPARLIGRKLETGGKVEVFLLRQAKNSPYPPARQSLPACQEEERGILYKSNFWLCLIGGHKRKEGLQVEFNKGLKAEVIKNNQDGTWLVRFNKRAKEMMKIVEKIGQVPLPPYIKNLDSRQFAYRRGGQAIDDRKRYQTIYADNKKIGSVAAPTAGFHFTKELIKELRKKGVQFIYITLHIGFGTFAPVKVADIIKHKMHSECMEVKKEVIEKIFKAKQEGRRIIAVGTTSARAIETVASYGSCSYSGWTDLFIYPGYRFKLVDGLITNFHLPKSTLLMLVCAFSSRKKIFKAYKEAIKRKYRFYSYGDAMFIT